MVGCFHPKMKSRAHLLITGRVQGVFYREHVRRWAASRGIKGWIRNNDDGSVEAVLEGEKDNLESLIGKMRCGPPMSRVDELKVGWESYLNEFGDFRITW